MACTRLVFCYLCVRSLMLCQCTISYGASKDLVLVHTLQLVLSKVFRKLKALNHATRIQALVVNQLWIWLNKLLLLPHSRNTTARHTDFSVFISQRLLHCTIFLASCLYYACSVTSFFSVRFFFKLVYGKRGSVWEAWLSTFNLTEILEE